MIYINRLLQSQIDAALARGKSILLFGPRQTGKTTLISRIPNSLSISFIQPQVRQKYEQNPAVLIGEIQVLAEKMQPAIPVVVIDEVQKVPEILDCVQDLIDRKQAQFILTGSSARKLRSGKKINLLPGRVVVFHLDPLLFAELSTAYKVSIEELLLYGSMPGIVGVVDKADKEQDLNSYVTSYLEEEIRAEAVVRNVGQFAKFLYLAASEAGNIINLTKLSQEIGVAHSTLISYYQILEDCLIIERIEPFTASKTRRRLIKSPKYLFFDLGVRRIAAREGNMLPAQYLGKMFEQWVGLELIKQARIVDPMIRINFWRDNNGPEVDYVIVNPDNSLIPIEVKLSKVPQINDAKHLQLFKTEYPNTKQAYIVCQCERKIKLADGIYALPWQEINALM